LKEETGLALYFFIRRGKKAAIFFDWEKATVSRGEETSPLSSPAILKASVILVDPIPKFSTKGAGKRLQATRSTLVTIVRRGIGGTGKSPQTRQIGEKGPNRYLR